MTAFPAICPESLTANAWVFLLLTGDCSRVATGLLALAAKACAEEFVPTSKPLLFMPLTEPVTL